VRYFPIPFSMFTEEKAFGGHLSFRQVAYIVVAIILLGVIFFLYAFSSIGYQALPCATRYRIRVVDGVFDAV